jgi:serine/threonine protein kinase
VVHRDLKPSNVLIGPDGVAKLADFGIAKGLDLTRVTGTSTLLGTPAYLAPEGPLDQRSDLYSLGIVAYELLTGTAPFTGSTYQEVIVRHIREAPDLSKLPPEARDIVGWLLAKDPKERPQRASALLPVLYGAIAAPKAPPVSAPASVGAQAAHSGVAANLPVRPVPASPRIEPAKRASARQPFPHATQVPSIEAQTAGPTADWRDPAGRPNSLAPAATMKPNWDQSDSSHFIGWSIVSWSSRSPLAQRARRARLEPLPGRWPSPRQHRLPLEQQLQRRSLQPAVSTPRAR